MESTNSREDACPSLRASQEFGGSIYIERGSSMDVVNTISFEGNTFRYLVDSALVRKQQHSRGVARHQLYSTRYNKVGEDPCVAEFPRIT